LKNIDEYGLCLENTFLTVYIPSSGKALVFRIKGRANKYAEVLNYGPFPIDSGDTFNSLDGGTTTAPADGVFPDRAYSAEGMLWEPPSDIASDVYDSTDMWYVPTDPPYNQRLFHVILETTPKILRIGLEVPLGTKQMSFQAHKVQLDVNKTFGWTRGVFETVHFPGIHYGYLFANDTNMDFYTLARFKYAEYIVDIPKSAEYIFNILTMQKPSHWVTLATRTYEEKIRAALESAYGFDGFPIYPVYEKQKAISEYERLLKEAKI